MRTTLLTFPLARIAQQSSPPIEVTEFPLKLTHARQPKSGKVVLLVTAVPLVGPFEAELSRAEKASFAAKGLCQWVLALDSYDHVLKVVTPKRARANQADQKYQTTLASL